MGDIFELWELGDDAKNKYLEGFNDGYNGLIIFLKGLESDDKILKVKFETYIAFRSANESYRLNSLYKKEFTNGINFASNSEFLKWIKEETHGIYNELNLIHYLICSNDDITDVINLDPPILEWQ